MKHRLSDLMHVLRRSVEPVTLTGSTASQDGWPDGTESRRYVPNRWSATFVAAVSNWLTE